MFKCNLMKIFSFSVAGATFQVLSRHVRLVATALDRKDTGRLHRCRVT